MVMNLNSPALLEDNLIWQAKTAGKRIVFYGDDTWVRLFPKHFMEYDGTTSFFVSDYTEVCMSLAAGSWGFGCVEDMRHVFHCCYQLRLEARGNSLGNFIFCPI